MSEAEQRRYHQLFSEVWKLFKKYCDPDGSEKFWERLRIESSILDNTIKAQSPEDPELIYIAQKMIALVIVTIQNIYRRKEGLQCGKADCRL